MYIDVVAMKGGCVFWIGGKNGCVYNAKMCKMRIVCIYSEFILTTQMLEGSPGKAAILRANEHDEPPDVVGCIVIVILVPAVLYRRGSGKRT
jgi:hypothetical protein